MHTEIQESVNLVCISCDKEFNSEHSLKQHMNSKRINVNALPVGHPERARKNNNETLKIACVKCDKRFSTGKDVEEHMQEHNGDGNTDQEYENPSVDKICRFFRNGYCSKGDECLFKHIGGQTNSTPTCNRGPGCFFFQQNRCHFFHPSAGIQQPRIQPKSSQRECRFKQQCWNIADCPFFHPGQGFRFARRQNRPPQEGVRGMSAWIDY